jgi:hypothetical protein
VRIFCCPRCMNIALQNERISISSPSQALWPAGTVPPLLPSLPCGRLAGIVRTNLLSVRRLVLLLLAMTGLFSMYPFSANMSVLRGTDRLSCPVSRTRSPWRMPFSRCLAMTDKQINSRRGHFVQSTPCPVRASQTCSWLPYTRSCPDRPSQEESARTPSGFCSAGSRSACSRVSLLPALSFPIQTFGCSVSQRQILSLNGRSIV